MGYPRNIDEVEYQVAAALEDNNPTLIFRTLHRIPKEQRLDFVQRTEIGQILIDKIATLPPEEQPGEGGFDDTLGDDFLQAVLDIAKDCQSDVPGKNSDTYIDTFSPVLRLWFSTDLGRLNNHGYEGLIEVTPPDLRPILVKRADIVRLMDDSEKGGALFSGILGGSDKDYGRMIQAGEFLGVRDNFLGLMFKCNISDIPGILLHLDPDERFDAINHFHIFSLIKEISSSYKAGIKEYRDILKTIPEPQRYEAIEGIMGNKIDESVIDKESAKTATHPALVVAGPEKRLELTRAVTAFTGALMAARPERRAELLTKYHESFETTRICTFIPDFRNQISSEVEKNRRYRRYLVLPIL